MFKPGRSRIIVNAIILALVFCLTARPTLNAASSEASSSSGPRSLAENLFQYATNLSMGLHERAFDERTASEYRRALDAYWQVTRLNTDTYFSAEALARMAELQREMADITNDSALYQQSIETFRRIVVEHPHSNFVGSALVSIAHVYEENLQDLDGAAAAYRELVGTFPSSVMAREARAVLTRFEAELNDRPVDVVASRDRLAAESGAGEASPAARLTNVRNFSGPDYARVVIDLSGPTKYEGARAGDDRLSVRLQGAVVSTVLYGRRFIVGESSLLKRITVHEAEAGASIEIAVGSLSDYSIFNMSDPERIVVDIHSAESVARTRYPNALKDSVRAPSDESAPDAVRRRSAVADRDRRPYLDGQHPILSLPEIAEPILPHNPAATGDKAPPAAQPPAVTAEAAKGAELPIKCIVIDAGHGGHDTGTISAGGMREKDLTLDVARRLKAYIKRNYPEVEVVLTRDSDRFVALEERTAIANSRRADLFISVHANASHSAVASGVETFFVSPDRAAAKEARNASRENTRPAASRAEGPDPGAPVQAAASSQARPTNPDPIVASVRVGNRVAESRELARYIQAGLVRGIGAASPRTAANRGVKHAPFAVLLGAAMPSVLAEVSFLSNPRDEALLQTSQFRERIAASLFAGLNGYLKKNRAAQAKR